MLDEYSAAELLGMSMFDRFEYTKVLSDCEKMDIIREALQLGKKRSEQIFLEFQGMVPSQILKQHGVSICEEVNKSAYSNFVKFAEFHVKQKKIFINEEALSKLSGHLDRTQIIEIILCHELYHYFEMFRWGRTGELFKRQVRLFSLIPVIRRVIVAEEIAANAFTKTFMGLDFEPQRLEQLYFESS